MFIKKRIQFNKDSGGAGGFVSLSDLDGDPIDTEVEAVKKDPPPPPEGETNEEKEERESKEKEVEEQRLQKLEDEKKAKEDEAQKLKDEEAAKAAAKKEPKTADKTEETDEDDDDQKFWDEVDKLKGGEPLEVDFGDVDPLSPEGIVIRDKAIEADAIARFEAHLEDRWPKAYALLEHMAAGGKFETFFQTMEASTDLPTEAELENNAALQEQIITRNLKRLGNSDKQITSLIKAAKVDDELEEMSKESLTSEKKYEETALAQVKQDAEKANKEKTESVNNLVGYINAEVGKGEIDGITIPEKDRGPFAKAFLESIRYDGGKFIMTTELTQENFNEVFKEKFFSFKKGDLGDLVKKAAKTENALRLRRTIKTTTPKGESGSGQNFTSLNDVD